MGHSGELLYLAGDVQVEPLFNNWYVCMPMIAPSIAPMLVANSHLKILQSFIDDPDSHIELCQIPEMIGGPFVDYGHDRVPEIKDLMQRTIQEQQHMLDFAAAVKELNGILKEQAKGASLESLYPEVPDILKGYVELVYDINSNPSIRFIEGLLYDSKYYDKGSQSICLSKTNGDSRSFVLSTPRLDADDKLLLNIPFESRALDALFSTREHGRTLDEIAELLMLDDAQKQKLSIFLTSDKPKVNNCIDSNTNEVKIKYFGHASILIEHNMLSILTDPVISYEYDTEISRYTYADLPPVIDYVVITHGHLDHIVLETLLQLRYKINNIIVPKSGSATNVDPSLKMLLNNLGFESVVELDELESIAIAGRTDKITATPFLGEHHDLGIKAKIAYLLTINDKKIYIAADSNNIEPKMYEHILNKFGEIDVLFVGLECDGAPLSWFYGHLLHEPLDYDMDQSRKGSGSDFIRAKKLVDTLKCKSVYVYAMGLEPWLTFILSIADDANSLRNQQARKLVEECLKEGKISKILYAKEHILV